MNSQTQTIVIWVIIGLVAGWLASLVVGGSGGLLGYLVAGLIGSFVGGFLARQFDIRLNLGNALVEQIVVSAVGAMIVLVVAHLIV